jgi:hypothetical protein
MGSGEKEREVAKSNREVGREFGRETPPSRVGLGSGRVGLCAERVGFQERLGIMSGGLSGRFVHFGTA